MKAGIVEVHDMVSIQRGLGMEQRIGDGAGVGATDATRVIADVAKIVVDGTAGMAQL